MSRLYLVKQINEAMKMSMHKEKLTKQEVEGLLAHGLPVGKPSQLSDAFISGMRFEQCFKCNDKLTNFLKQCASFADSQDAFDSCALNGIAINAKALLDEMGEA